MHSISSATLIGFESRIAHLFNEGKIPHPIHLSQGNEEFLIKIFNNIKPSDWVFSTWRSYYYCLLKGVPENLIEQSILAGKSIALNFPKYKFFFSNSWWSDVTGSRGSYVD
jgi:TPP-dependent pyruvate/acetoin dehydrogenase alpha subunit